jgi:hypothetical protein
MHGGLSNLLGVYSGRINDEFDGTDQSPPIEAKGRIDLRIMSLFG